MTHVFIKRSANLTALLLLSLQLCSNAQTAITDSKIDTSSVSASTSYSRPRAHDASTTAFPDAGNYTYKFGAASGFTDNVKTLKSFIAGGSGYTYNSGTTSIIKIRRVENSSFNNYWSSFGASPESNPTPRDLAYYEGSLSGTTLNIKSPYIPKMESLFLSNDITIGIDNLFANSPATNFNNIERIDVVVPAGLVVAVPSAQGFAIFERGTYDAHDPSVVTLITAVDASNNPTAYASAVVRVPTSAYYVTAGTSSTPNMVYQPSSTASGNFIVMRRDSTTGKMAGSDLIGADQGIGGVLIKFSDFGIAPGTTVYGYSVLAGDFPTTATGANAVDYTNTTNFPTTTSGASGEGGNDMAVITGVVKILNISGNVYRDANGLTNGLVDGTPISKASGTQLYVNLVDASNIVVGTATVDSATGSFTFDKLAFGQLTARISTTAGVIGSAAPAAVLPSGWRSTGENYGTNNAAGSGNEAGTPNSVIGVVINDQNITGIRFGIEQAPTATGASYTIPQPAGHAIYTLTTDKALGVLKGSDPEDYPAGGTLSGKKVVINSVSGMNGNQLYYGNTLVTPGFTINNYDSTLLKIRFEGTGSTSASFTFSYTDAAGFSNPSPATYSISWGTALPLQLLSFNVRSTTDNSVLLDWETADEQNIAQFTISRSQDGRQWTEAGQVLPSAEHLYTFTDHAPENGLNYYRLKITDRDASYSLSPVKTISMNGVEHTGIIAYPNPVKDILYLRHTWHTTISNITVYDLMGSRVMQVDQAADHIDLSGLPDGAYMLYISTGDGNRLPLRIQKYSGL